MLTEESLRSKINETIPEVYNVIAMDTSSGCGQSFEVVVVSDTFIGKNKLARSRLVNKALHDEINQIHAFSCKCYTQEEWSKIVV
ncbi:hypothetical protein Kpol_423p7 [Vanderwaltozyma polyspora DSM 70294]|uniref:BolA-like protein n=1 Tax=Vanderwaltozyma polyspora (strain ATCC 22028 / DSM 70294 / BCRC 21397 / CBS 2163 / NBRC 10782 / NRRL Y-8283 / UCD 57-17) TaxID=436907 RepID=A7TR84_VANPO|nr:uncharacterized protein Kpol_423p7 [Vanderwaltozyma polyspora DSM 70294]EDO15217.1 hypothetical protein Kpol_423p7 [Vanderwaltozyma polyspora DSM 70294]